MKLEILDEQALESLLVYSMNHRAAIANWALKQLEATQNPVDKDSLAVEIFEKLLAAVEDLEMLYFALQRKLSKPDVSFLRLYSKVSIHEEGDPAQPTTESAAEILRQLEKVDAEGFRSSLGLPTVEEYHRVFKGGQGTPAEVEAEYLKYLGELRAIVMDAVKNRAANELMKTYNRIKHGFVVMRDPTDGIFMVQSVESVDGSKSIIEGKPFAPDVDKLRKLVTTIELIARLCRELLMLHFRRTPQE